MDDVRDRIAELDEEIAFLERQIASLARDRKRLPWLLVVALMSPVLWVFFGAWIGLGALFGSLAFVVGGYYITFGHQSEYREKLERHRGERDELVRKARRAAREDA